MHTILIFIYCSKNTFLRVLGPRLQIEIFDFPDYFFSNARTLTGVGGSLCRFTFWQGIWGSNFAQLCVVPIINIIGH